jgi:hypothetical protein
MVRLFVALLAAIAIPCLVQAQPPAVACPPVDGAGQAIDLTAPLNEPARLGLGYALMIGVASDDRDWPHSKLAVETPCTLGTFKVGAVDWTLNGGADAALPRWAAPASGDGLAFLTRTPSVQQGYAYSQASQKPMMMSLGSAMYALVIEREQSRLITRLYDGVPPMSALLADMDASLRGARAPIAALDPVSGAVSFIIATQSQRRAIIPGLLPGEGGKAARLQSPDGDLFVAAPGGAARMTPTHFLCPASLEGMALRDLDVGDATEAARDLSCSFVGDKGRISVSVTRHADRPPAKALYDDNIESIKKTGFIAGAAPQPLGAGPPPRPLFATAWADRNNQRQGLWLTAISDWYVEVLATYSSDSSGDIGKAVGQIYKDAFREIVGR